MSVAAETTHTCHVEHKRGAGPDQSCRQIIEGVVGSCWLAQFVVSLRPGRCSLYTEYTKLADFFLRGWGAGARRLFTQ